MNFKKIHKQLQRPLVRGLILIPPLTAIVLMISIGVLNIFYDIFDNETGSFLFKIYCGVNATYNESSKLLICL